MRRSITSGLAALLLFCIVGGCGKQGQNAPPVSTPNGANVPDSSTQANAHTANSVGSPILPDSSRTPGATLDVTKDDVCVAGYSKKVRNVPSSLKNQVYADYGITHRQPREYEVDHLISLELGGSNSPKNLWPQSYKTNPWNASVKDKLENRLHSLVCSGEISLQTAQEEIAKDWIAAYKKYFHTDLPASSHAEKSEEGVGADPDTSTESDATGSGSNAAAEVWVNTRSGKYFHPDSRYYGNTKEGQYMPESDAVRQGYHAAGEH